MTQNQKDLAFPDKLLDIIKQLPNDPGVYQYFNDDGIIIYIGKAKNLRKRVSSYFNRDVYENNKLRVLVNKIRDIRYIVVDSESDALLLENNLIKKYQPRYNILLKDDKTFPWICIKKERFSRVFYTRNYINDGSEYFGPYTSVVMVKTLLSLVRKLYPLRNCSLDLSEEKIKAKKYRTCLEFHLGNCKAPCIDLQSELDYLANIKSIKEILKGNITDIFHYLNDLMKKYALEMDFENANLIKNRIDIITNYQSKSTVVNSSINNVDVFSFIEDDDNVCVNYLRVVSGAIIQVHSIEIKKKLDEKPEDLLTIAITDIRQKMLSNSKEIIVPFMPDIVLPTLKYTIPKQGDKLKLLELSERNARIFLTEKLKIAALKTEGYKNRSLIVLERIQSDLRLTKLPCHIECFDNSNIQGTNPVAACVVFKNGKPAVSEYRHFNVKTVVGADDFATMREIVFRRYKRMIDENAALPDLIVVDGGKGQLSAAVDSLRELDMMGKVAIIGIAKRLEEIFKPGDPVPLYIDKNSSSLKVIQHIRNEAHRFGINFHRLKRSESMTNSELDQIVGIGDKTKEDLLKNFKSLENIRNANLDQIIEIIGNSKAQKVFAYFKTQK
jgi:excinuclease ABC subunit C